MADNRRRLQRSDRSSNRCDCRTQDIVLFICVSDGVHALQLDADRKIIALIAVFKARVPSVPGALDQRYILDQLTITPDQ